MRLASLMAARAAFESFAGEGAGGAVDVAAGAAEVEAWAGAEAAPPDRRACCAFLTEGGGVRQRLTLHCAPKRYKTLPAIREGAMVPSGSSNAIMRDELELGWNSEGQRTQEGS